MDEAKGPNGSLMAGHGPESWLSRWERQCLEEDERQGIESGAGGTETDAQRQRLWLSFQNSASAIAQLYKERVCEQPLGIQSLWKPFQAAATSVTCLYKDGLEMYRTSLDLGVQGGYQRRNKEMLAWAKKRRHIIHREDLLSFLCRKSPPSRSSRLTPRLNIPSAGLGVQEDSGRTAESDLQAFTDAIAVHGLSGAMANVSMRSGAPETPSHTGSHSASARRRNSLQDMDLNSFIAEEMARHLESSRKRAPAQCTDVITEPPSHKRSRML
ncbi:HUWE1-associated protein modifying stress responses 1-like isoform X1 [Mobula birostris]|uniref:HUWE1-associated protein modifying stress responses 1-like isoform X1 n=1 Tax=Mobula birostris TaxID=1983395 RepID=UPI003B28980E